MLATSSPWIDLCSPDPLIADISRQVLSLEIAYAGFCNVRNVAVPGPRLHRAKSRSDGVVQYARAVREVLNSGQYIQIQIWLPMADSPDAYAHDGMGHLAPFAREQYLLEAEDEGPKKVDFFGAWDAWNVIRTVCNYSSRLFVGKNSHILLPPDDHSYYCCSISSIHSVSGCAFSPSCPFYVPFHLVNTILMNLLALSIPKHLPPFSVQSRWHSEPIQIITLEAKSFIKNAKGYSVLSRSHQAFIHKMMRLRAPPWILLCDVGSIPGTDNPDAIYSMSDGILSPDATADVSNSTSSPSPTPAEASTMMSKPKKKFNDPTPHLSYIRNLQQKQPPRTPIEKFGGNIYQDYLQAPLQPLTVNLESLTYEVFEQDPIKYDWYERAIARALSDWVEQGKPTSSPEGRVVIAVVGAGRGPLVTRALRASEDTGVDVEVWAIEKNPNAFVLLQRHNEMTWGGRVNLVQSDMRSWKGPWRESIVRMVPTAVPPFPGQAITSDSDPSSSNYTDDEGVIPVNHAMHTPIDILVSELLGSFGDNELSPECLDGIVHLLNPTHGISIPQSYSAHLTPISAPRLHADIAARASSDPTAPETPYVVWLHAIDYLSTTPPAAPKSPPPSNPKSPDRSSTLPQVVTLQTPPVPIVHDTWTFHHSPTPTPLTSPTNSHNSRSCTLRFPIPHHGLLHGLAGYFTAVLYAPGNPNPTLSSGSAVELTTNPVTMEAKSNGMISWFPIFFPLKQPLWVPDEGEVEVGIWRCTDGRKVWYEWCVEIWRFEGERNGEGEGIAEKGKRVRVGMSELHSSVKGACLM
jgi:protein arginine N-methyltransferase 5